MFCFLNNLYNSKITLLMVSTDSRGNSPLAVYPDNIVQSVKSKTAFVTSDISALDGLTLLSID